MTRSSLKIIAAVGLLAVGSADRARAAEPVGVGQQAPGFSLRTLDQKTVALADLTRQGPAVVVVLRGYPGYQCPICTRQVAAFVAKADAFKAAGASLVFIYPGPSADLEARAAEFVGDNALPEPFRFVIDPDYAFTNAWNLRWDAPKETAYPSTFVVDQQNVIRWAKVSKTHGDRTSPDDVLAAVAQAKSTPATRPAR